MRNRILITAAFVLILILGTGAFKGTSSNEVGTDEPSLGLEDYSSNRISRVVANCSIGIVYGIKKGSEGIVYIIKKAVQ